MFILFYFNCCRHLCVYVDAKAVYCTLADILLLEEDLSFVGLVVRVLNSILFSSVELFEMRVQLQSMQGHVSLLNKALKYCLFEIISV